MVSSIKSSTAELAEDATSYEEGDNSILNARIVDDNETVENQNKNVTAFSSTYAQSTAEQKPETLPSTANRIGESESNYGKDLSKENDWSDPLPSFLSSKPEASTLKVEKRIDLEEPSQEVVNDQKDTPENEIKPSKPPSDKGRTVSGTFARSSLNAVKKETTVKKNWSDPLPPFLSSISKASTLRDERQVDLEEPSPQVSDDEKAGGESDEEKPPPLAGANVMNIILVAAECAPWSKTGTIFCAHIIGWKVIYWEHVLV